MAGKTKIVIIGASYAGIGLAQALLKSIPNIRVVLINPSNQFFFNIAAPRILAKPTAFQPNQYLIPIAEAFQNVPPGSFEFIQGSASAIDPTYKSVTVPGEGIFPYDYLVIASGSTTVSSKADGSSFAPFKTVGDHLGAAIKASQQQIAAAKNVVIGGAGAVGVEFAGELAEAFAGKSARVTLVSASWHVLPTLKKAGSERAEQILSEKGVKLIRSRKVTKAKQDPVSKKWAVTLDDGQTLDADLYISTTGVVPNNNFIPSDYLNNSGWVKVDEEMRVNSKNSNSRLPIYAIGDITEHPARLFLKVQEQIPVVANNLKVDILGKGKRKTYTTDSKVMMIVPVGSTSGSGQMFGMVPWGKMVAMIKGKDFFVSKARNMMGIK